MILNNNSEFVDSALKCMEVFPFIWRRIPRFSALILVKTGRLASWKFRIIFAAMESHFPSGLYSLGSIPLHFLSRTDESPVTFRKPLCVRLHFLWIRSASFFNISFCPSYVVGYWHEDDSVRELFWCSIFALQVVLDLLENLQCCESWENIPLGFNCFSINS